MLLGYDREKMIETCRKYNIFLLILHGSQAKGLATEWSDVDIGILGEPAVIKDKYMDIMGDLADIFGDKCDPVFLNGAEALISYYVARDGQPLYEKTKGLFSSFQASAIARYMDTRKFRLLEKQYIKSVIQEMG